MKEKILALEKKHGPIQINCKGNDSLPLDIILDFQGNLKKRSKDNLLKLIGRIFKLGFIAPFFVWDKQGDYFCFDGHGRIEALSAIREAGVEIPGLFPVVYIHAETDEQAREILLSISSQYGEFDEDELAEWIDGLDDEIAESLRLVDQEIALSMPEEETAGDDEIPDDPEPVTKLGDIWELGGHRLLCGDSTDQAAVERLMDGKKADMVFTDPPYGMFLNADFSTMKNSPEFAMHKNIKNGKKYRNVIGDHEDFNPDFINTIFDNFGYCKEIFMWGADYYSEYLRSRNEGSWVVWDKRLDESADKMYGSCFELCWSKKRHKRMLARIKWACAFGTEKEFDHKRHHPTQKPIILVEWFFDYYSLKDKKNIADPFLGSGSTLIACEKTNRICYGMELDPHYCDVIVNRYSVWCEENGREPVIKLNGKPYSL